MTLTVLSEPSVGLGLVTALASACTFALGTSLQHRAGGTTPDATQGVVRILKFLVTKPSWLLGVGIAAAGLVLHAMALNFASLAIVQPTMVAGVALAVPLREALSRHLPSRREMGAVLITTVGLAVFLVAATPEPSSTVPGLALTLTLVLSGIGSAVALAVIGSRMRRHKIEALLLGVASGVLFGLSAALLKVLVIRIGEFGLLGLASWPLVGLAVIGALGMSFNQRAYRIARLSASMPALNVVAVLSSILLGAIMFGEVPASGVLALTAQSLALACIAIGLRRIARLHDPSLPASTHSSATKEAHEGPSSVPRSKSTVVKETLGKSSAKTAPAEQTDARKSA